MVCGYVFFARGHTRRVAGADAASRCRHTRDDGGLRRLASWLNVTRADCALAARHFVGKKSVGGAAGFGD
jgi:hypothetical protein